MTSAKSDKKKEKKKNEKRKQIKKFNKQQPQQFAGPKHIIWLFKTNAVVRLGIVVCIIGSHYRIRNLVFLSLSCSS